MTLPVEYQPYAKAARERRLGPATPWRLGYEVGRAGVWLDAPPTYGTAHKRRDYLWGRASGLLDRKDLGEDA